MSDPVTDRATTIVEARILDDKKNLLRKQIAFLRKWGKDVYDEYRGTLTHFSLPVGNPTYQEMIDELTDSLKKTRTKLKSKLEKLQEEET